MGCVPECVKSYFIDEDLYIQGNRIFKKLNTELDINNKNLSQKEINSLQECMKLLQEAEKVRIEISKKFEIFLYNTGACVLKQPNFERGLITFIINLIIQILISANENNVKFNKEDISFDKFIFISTSVPFIELNKNVLNILKKKYGFNFYENEILMNGINSIIDFLSTLPSIKSVLENQVIILKNLVFESITNIHMLDQLEDAIDGLVFLIDFFNEISNGIIETQIKLSKPKKIQLFFKIAESAANKKLKDPKKIALLYSSGDNCGSVDKWKENMTYKEFYRLKY